MSSVGFTGTRHGMTAAQRCEVDKWLSTRELRVGHHGDCVGADAQFHDLLVKRDIPIVIHPPDNDKARAFCSTGNIIEVKEPLPYLARNRVIVKSAVFMLATPSEGYEPEPARGQGTWSTVRFARGFPSAQRPEIVIFWPNGEVT